MPLASFIQKSTPISNKLEGIKSTFSNGHLHVEFIYDIVDRIVLNQCALHVHHMLSLSLSPIKYKIEDTFFFVLCVNKAAYINLVRKLHRRRVEVGAKLCLRKIASATSDKFSFIFGQYLLAGKKCFSRISFIFGLLPLRHLSDASFTYIIML